jgi:hypothetical protein
MEYYDLQRNWRRVRPHLSDPPVSRTLVRDFNKFTFGRWERKFLPGMVPRQFESCDWDYEHRGRRPAYWEYVKHAACHWLVNHNLELAQASVPDRAWRIVTSQQHSTVWDGEQLLFDFNFLALGITPDECIALARRRGRELRPGQHRRTYFAQHWRAEMTDAALAQREGAGD